MEFFEIFLRPESYIALLTLCLLEIILGIDNIIFISIVTNKLPPEQQRKARNIGLSLALGFRVVMLLGIKWIIGFTKPLFSLNLFGEIRDFSTRDIILFLGGLFLVTKSTLEIHEKMDPDAHDEDKKGKAITSMGMALVQIVLLDVIFSFDSILTAIGMTEELPLMIVAVVVAILIMMFFSKAVSEFIDKHPTLQILALSFLILIGFMLLLEGFHVHVAKGYIYFAVFFSLAVEAVNMRVRKARKNASN